MSRRRWCRSAGSGVSAGSEGPASVHDVKDPSFWGIEAAGGDLDRQTTLPRGRGVCLIPSSCPGTLTAATGSELAGRRLQGCALRTVLSHRAPRGRRWPCGATPSITSVSDGSIWFGRLFLPIHGLSPRTARPPRGREEARSAGRWGSFEGWPCATPPCEERGAKHDATSTPWQTMTGEFRAGHGRQRSQTGREDQADATSGGRRGGTKCSAGGATLADRRE